MDPKYIVAIILAGLFFVLLFSFLIVYIVRLKKAKEFQAVLDKVYLDSNLAKMEYDFAVYDDETAEFLSKMNSGDEKQVTIDDVLNDGKSANYEDVFAKIDSEGLEEITGNYNPKK